MLLACSAGEQKVTVVSSSVSTPPETVTRPRRPTRGAGNLRPIQLPANTFNAAEESAVAGAVAVGLVGDGAVADGSGTSAGGVADADPLLGAVDTAASLSGDVPGAHPAPSTSTAIRRTPLHD